MKAMILAAGLGTRMRPLTDHCPKPLLPLLLQPILEHILTQLPRHDIRDVIINLHHHADQLARWLGDGSRWGVHLSLSFEPEILGTAGSLETGRAMVARRTFFRAQRGRLDRHGSASPVALALSTPGAGDHGATARSCRTLLWRCAGRC